MPCRSRERGRRGDASGEAGASQLELPGPVLRPQVLAGPQPQATPVPFAKSCHFATSPLGDCLLHEEWKEPQEFVQVLPGAAGLEQRQSLLAAL